MSPPDEGPPADGTATAPDERSRQHLARRGYLAGVTALATGLAGCSMLGGSEPGADTPAPDPTPTSPQTTPQPSTSGPSETRSTAPDPAIAGLDLETDSVRQTRPFTVRVEVSNTGTAAAQVAVFLRSNRVATDTLELEIEPGASRTVPFTLRVPDPGAREVTAVLSAAGRQVDSASRTVSVGQYPVSFVDTAGTDFVAGGDRYRYAGVNNNHLPVKPWGQQYVDRLLDHVAGHGISVVRTWGFPPAWTDATIHPEPGTFRTDWFTHFDYVVLAAKRRGIRLVLPLINNWHGPGHAPGPAAYADWSDTAATVNDFFEDEQATQYYHNYIERFLTHENQYTGVEYRDDPTILMWEVGNQMEYHDERRGEPLTEWYDGVARRIKAIDDNHLVGTGMAGATGDVYERWNVRNAYIDTHESPAIDACCFHTYPIKRWQGETTVRDQDNFATFVRTHINEAHEQVGKPVYFGEFGAIADPDAGLPVERRNEFFRTATDVARSEGLDGIQFWFPELRDPRDIGVRRDHTDNPLAIFPDQDSTWEIIEAYADDMSAAPVVGDG